VEETEGLGCSIGYVLLSGAIGGGRGVFAWSASSGSVLGVVIFGRRAGVCSMVSLSSSRGRLCALQSDGRPGMFSVHCSIPISCAI
jgi:hypothetical protein